MSFNLNLILFFSHFLIERWGSQYMAELAGGDDSDDGISPVSQSNPDYRLSAQSENKDIEFFISSDARFVYYVITRSRCKTIALWPFRAVFSRKLGLKRTLLNYSLKFILSLLPRSNELLPIVVADKHLNVRSSKII